MSTRRKAKPTKSADTIEEVLASKMRARPNKLTNGEREALITEVAAVVRGAAVAAAEHALATIMAGRSAGDRGKATDPKSRKQRAVRALAKHPRAAQILESVDFREPTPAERQIAASLKQRARGVKARHAKAA